MPSSHPPGLGLVAAAAALLALAACDLPFGLDLASTRTLENGAAGGLSSAGSFEMKGTYSGPDGQWTVDMQLARPAGEHIAAGATSTSGGPGLKLEAIVIGDVAYYRGREFLAQNLGGDALSQSIVQSAGDSWWKGPSGLLPQLPDFTDGSSFRTTFLGPVVTRRIDHTSVDGMPAVEMSSPRADVFISAVAPYNLLRVHLVKGATVDAISEADFRYGNFNQDFQIKPPPDVIDFSNLSTLPPTLYGRFG